LRPLNKILISFFSQKQGWKYYLLKPGFHRSTQESGFSVKSAKKLKFLNLSNETLKKVEA